jgi:hypothetical protein
MNQKKRKTRLKMTKDELYICVDFDGTCTTHFYPRIGKDIGAVPVLKKLVEEGHKLILFTMRSGDTLKEAEKWFADNGIPLFGIQTNPTQKRWTSSPKAYGHLYIDDAALGCPLKQDKALSDRVFVNWDKVRLMLIERGIISWKEVEAKDVKLENITVKHINPEDNV